MADRRQSIYLRTDSIEQAKRSSGVLAPEADMGPAGYMAAYPIAADNLRLGHVVIADSVNPVKITRDAYRDVAEQLGIRSLEVEVVCSDNVIHRNRVETRHSTVEGLTSPTWKQVERRQ